MVEDIVRTLGFLCLGSRLKRIGERLQADTQLVLNELDVPLQSSQYPFLAALDRIGPLTVGELARCLGITQPAVTRTLSHLIDLAMVESRPSADDQRQRVVALTAAGRRLVARARRDVWPRIDAAVADLCGGLSGPLLAQLDQLEDGLGAASVHRRTQPLRKVRR
jgi:DNA-binding MarR family transcriptional regulator